MSDEHKKLLETQLWAIANILRGKISANQFQDYILGFIFYKYLSEKLEKKANEFLKPDGIVFNEKTQIRQMFSHTHKRGKRFLVYKVGGSNDGELLYSAFDYQHPPYLFFNTPLVVEAGEGIKTVVTYDNETDRDIRFGVTSEDEMGILFFAKIQN